MEFLLPCSFRTRFASVFSTLHFYFLVQCLRS
uniref:Uncharacterized protein n=1 Tax=Arundo donax TaxID=35708 RepID=A0A0A9B7S9_ARUDO